MSSVATIAVGGSCWLRNGRCLGARVVSCLGTLVPLVASWVSVGGNVAPGGTDLGWRGVAFGDDGASLGFGDDAAVGVAQWVVGAGAQTGGDSGEQDRSQRTDRGIVVLTGEHEPLVADGQGGGDLAGVVGGDEQGLAQAAIAGLGRSAVAVGLAGGVGGRDQPGE